MVPIRARQVATAICRAHFLSKKRKGGNILGTAERRLAIYRYLCRYRYAKMSELATEFEVSIRTIQRDIYEIEYSLHLPIVTKPGKHNGGIYVLDTHQSAYTYRTPEELRVLQKAHDLLEGTLSFEELLVLEKMIESGSTFI